MPAASHMSFSVWLTLRSSTLSVFTNVKASGWPVVAV